MKKLIPKQNNTKDSENADNKPGLSFESINSWIKSILDKNNSEREKSNLERDNRLGRKVLPPSTPYYPVRGYKKGRNGAKLYSRI